MPRLHRGVLDGGGDQFYRIVDEWGVTDAGARTAVDWAFLVQNSSAGEVGGDEVSWGGLRLGEDGEGVGGEGDERDYGDAEEGEGWEVHSFVEGRWRRGRSGVGDV